MDHHDDWILFRLHRLDPARFEALCFALLKATGHTEIHPWGDAGNDGGVDLLSIGPDGRRWVTQCKRVLNLSPSRARPELQKVFDQLPQPPPEVYRLVATCPISRKTEEELQSLAHQEQANGKPAIEIAASWTETHLIAFLRDDFQDLRGEFVGPLGPLPFWNVPRGTEFFTGREELLETLQERIESARTAALTQAIVGLGGIGKTQTAIEYCRRHRSRYDAGVFWVDASSPATLLTGYAKCAQRLELAPLGTPEYEAVEAFLHHLESHPGWLVVLDNADDPGEIRDLLPTDAHGHVLLTTRVQNPDLGRAEPLRVDCLPLEQATGFLLERGHRKPAEQPQAERLAAALGGLPLALEQAGAFLAYHTSVAVGVYLDTFEKQAAAFLEQQPPRQGGYQGTVATTWEISFRKVEDTAPAAVEALQAFAFLDPEDIPLRLCLEGGEKLGPALAELASRAREEPIEIHTQLVTPLTRYSLVEFDPEQQSFSLHRLVQEVIRQRLGEEVPAILHRVYEALDRCFPEDPASPASWQEGASFLPHVRASAALWTEETGAEPTALWMRAGWNARAAGRASQSRDLEESALEVRRRVLGAEHPSTLISMNNLASTLWALGDAQGARELLAQAYMGFQKVLGEDHPDTRKIASNLRALEEDED